MPEADVIHALHDKQDELTTGINRLEQQIGEYRAGLAHLEEVICLFDPSIQPELAQARHQTAQRMRFRPGESLRHALQSVRRHAQHLPNGVHWLTIEWLPKYAPELNDFKELWRDLKRHHLAHQTFTGAEDLTHAIHDAVAKLNKERTRYPLGRQRIAA